MWRGGVFNTHTHTHITRTHAHRQMNRFFLFSQNESWLRGRDCSVFIWGWEEVGEKMVYKTAKNPYNGNHHLLIKSPPKKRTNFFQRTVKQWRQTQLTDRRLNRIRKTQIIKKKNLLDKSPRINIGGHTQHVWKFINAHVFFGGVGELTKFFYLG